MVVVEQLGDDADGGQYGVGGQEQRRQQEHRHDGKGEHGPASATFATALPKPGKYEVFLAVVPNANRATNAQVRLSHAHGQETIRVNLALPAAGNLRSLGTFEFTDRAQVVVTNEGANGYVVIDAVNWAPRP